MIAVMRPRLLLGIVGHRQEKGVDLVVAEGLCDDGGRHLQDPLADRV